MAEEQEYLKHMKLRIRLVILCNSSKRRRAKVVSTQCEFAQLKFAIKLYDNRFFSTTHGICATAEMHHGISDPSLQINKVISPVLQCFPV